MTRITPPSIYRCGRPLHRGRIGIAREDLVYLVRAPDGALLYVGLTGDNFAERLRRHGSKRRPTADDVGLFSRVCAVMIDRGAWLVAAAPPAAFVPYIAAAVTGVRDRLEAEGVLPARLDTRVAAARAQRGAWASSARLVEWTLIASAGPRWNRKGNVYCS